MNCTGIPKRKFIVGRALLTKQGSRSDTHVPNQRFKRRLIWRGLKVFDDRRRDASVSDQRKRVAGRSTSRFVVDRNGDKGFSHSGPRPYELEIGQVDDLLRMR